MSPFRGHLCLCLLVLVTGGLAGTESPEADPVLNGIDRITDDEKLWDLLKKASRNQSDPNQNVVYDYGDYVELDEDPEVPGSTPKPEDTADITDPTEGSLLTTLNDVTGIATDLLAADKDENSALPTSSESDSSDLGNFDWFSDVSNITSKGTTVLSSNTDNKTLGTTDENIKEGSNDSSSTQPLFDTEDNTLKSITRTNIGNTEKQSDQYTTKTPISSTTDIEMEFNQTTPVSDITGMSISNFTPSQTFSSFVSIITTVIPDIETAKESTSTIDTSATITESQKTTLASTLTEPRKTTELPDPPEYQMTTFPPTTESQRSEMSFEPEAQRSTKPVAGFHSNITTALYDESQSDMISETPTTEFTMTTGVRSTIELHMTTAPPAIEKDHWVSVFTEPQKTTPQTLQTKYLESSSSPVQTDSRENTTLPTGTKPQTTPRPSTVDDSRKTTEPIVPTVKPKTQKATAPSTQSTSKKVTTPSVTTESEKPTTKLIKSKSHQTTTPDYREPQTTYLSTRGFQKTTRTPVETTTQKPSLRPTGKPQKTTRRPVETTTLKPPLPPTGKPQKTTRRPVETTTLKPSLPPTGKPQKTSAPPTVIARGKSTTTPTRGSKTTGLSSTAKSTVIPVQGKTQTPSTSQTKTRKTTGKDFTLSKTTRKMDITKKNTFSKKQSTNPTFNYTPNKFDPKRISLIENDNDDVIEPLVPKECRGKHCQPTDQKKVKVFDTKKLFMIDEVTSPTIRLNDTKTTAGNLNKVNFNAQKKYYLPDESKEIPIDIPRIVPNKHKFNPSRTFLITDEKAQPTPSHFQPPNGHELRPIINLSVNFSSEDSTREQTQVDPVDRPDLIKTSNTIPELMCFQIRSQDNRIRLSCINVESAVKAQPRPFHIEFRSRNEFPLHQTNGFRNVYFQGRNRYALVRTMNSPTRTRISYDFRRSEGRKPDYAPSLTLRIPVGSREGRLEAGVGSGGGLLGQGQVRLGQGQVLLGQGQGLLGQGQVRLGEGQGLMGQGQVRLGEGQGLMGQGQVRLGEGQVLLEQGQVLLGQGQARLGQGQGLLGQGQARLGQGQGLLGQSQVRLGEGQGLLGQGQVPLGQGQVLLGQGQGLLGQSHVRLGQGQVRLGEGQVLLGQGQGLLGQGQVRLGEGQGLMGQGQVRLGEGQVLLGQGQGLLGQSHVRLGQGQVRLGEGQVLLGQGQGLLLRRTRAAGGYCNPDDADNYSENGRSLTFVFDNTMSMHTELEQMRETAKEITTQLTGLKKALIRDYVLVRFNDPNVAEPFCTTSYTEFLEALDAIRVHGGGDCPEMALEGLEKALMVSRPKSFVFVITDATPKDGHKEESVLKLVMRKQPSIFFLITGVCNEVSIAAYTNISQASINGEIIKNLDKSGVTNVIEEINKYFIISDLVVLSKSTTAVAGNSSKNVSVDSSLKHLTFVVSGEKPSLKVASPSGNKYPGVNTSLPSLVVVDVEKPMPGIWKVAASSTSTHTVSAIGKSGVNFRVGFSVVPTDKISETSHRPLKGEENYILIEVSDPKTVENITSIELIGVNGEPWAKLYLKRLQTVDTLYSGGPFIPPDQLFTMQMHGYDKKGISIDRISPTAILAQLPELPYITMQSRVTVEAGKELTIRCHVESLVSISVKIFKKSSGSAISPSHSYKQTGDVYLTLKNVMPEDEGVYRCWAKNVAGEQYKEIEIQVLVRPPTVTVDSEILFQRDHRVEIRCMIDSPVNYTVQWTKGEHGRLILRNNFHIHISSEGIIIEKAEKADEGWYKCSARNIGGQADGVTYLRMSTVPDIELSADRSFRRSYDITINCSSSGVPLPAITWLKDGHEIPIDRNGRISTQYGIIHIHNAIQEDEGTYSCTAANKAGTVTKDTYLTYEELPRIIPSRRILDFQAGNDILLTCNATGVPPPQVHWEKDGMPINQDTVPFSTVLADRSLLIRPSSLLHNGVYTCSAINNIGIDEISITVRVLGVKPEIQEPPIDIYIEIGGSGKLTCDATGHPEPNISWRRSTGISIRATKHLSSLEFINASLSDGGEYWCIAENALGREEARAEVHITNGAPPVIRKIEDIEVVKVLAGEKIELTCPSTGNPPPSIQWFKNGSNLSGHPWKGILLANGSYLISAVNIPEIGIFECVAVNELGRDSKKIELKLYEPPRISTSSKFNVLTTLGNSAKLICDVTGDPKPNVTWRYSHHNHQNKILKGTNINSANELFFEKVEREDSGRYICKAENIAGTATRTFSLYVMVPPKIEPWPIEMFVEIGNIVSLECQVRASPRPSILWLKDNNTIPQAKYYGSFMRFYAHSDDSGSYSCTAENKAGKERVETNLIVLVPPQIAESPPTVEVISGTEAILPCEVFGNPHPSIAWQWNEELIKKELGSTTGALHLHNVTEADAGTYTCTAQNKAGTNKRKTELIVLTPPKILPWTQPIKVTLGDFLNVTCQHFANPVARVTWYKDKEQVPPKYIGENNRLEFFVEPFHEGIFTCRTVNVAGVDSKDFLLVILDPPTFAQNLPFTFDVLNGKDIDIPCVAFGDPKPIMGWNRSEVILASSIKRIMNSETGVLTIRNASVEDEGLYNCTARNKAGEIWRTVELNVLEIPTSKLEVSNDIIKEGDEVIFTCRASGKPFPKIYWKKDDKVLSTENNDQLRLIAYFKDKGNYTCVVKNSAGEDHSTVFLNVSVSPVIYGQLEERLVVLEGDDISLNCSSEGIPHPDVVWFFNGTQLDKYSIHYERQVHDSILKLKAVMRKGDGLYSCEVKNFGGSAKKQFRLYVHVKPYIIDDFESQIILPEGKDLSLPCNALGIPEPTITWINNGSALPKSELVVTSPSIYQNLLLILNATESTAGVYICNATNEDGFALKEYTILVEDIEKPIDPGVEYIEMVQSFDGVLNCGAKPGSEITWLKNNETLDKVSPDRGDDVHFSLSDGGQTLKIYEVFDTDSGMFSCHATHPDGNTTKYFSVNILVPPFFRDIYSYMFSDTEYIVEENKSLSLECPIKGNPPPVVNWRMALSNIPVNKFTVPGVYSNSTSLVFRSAKPSHTGLYLCLASNKLGKEARTYNVKVVGPPKKIGPEVTQLDVVSGAKLELNCSVESIPDPLFQWSLRRGSGEETTLKYISQKILLGYTQDEDDGLYVCTASNPYGNVTKMFNVSVYDVPRIKREADYKIVLAEREDLYLHCVSDGTKLCSVKWFFNGQELNSSVQMSANLSVVNKQIEYSCKVFNISRITQGNYSCLVSNIAGSDERNFEVEVIAPPELTKVPVNEILQKNVGDLLSIECPLISANVFKIEWKKNGVILPEFENQTLQILSLNVQDEGSYTCIGSNIAGKQAFKFEVNVLAAPEFLAFDEVNMTIPLGESLILNCSVSGNPKPDILWVKNLQQIDEIELPQIVLLNDKQILEIDEVDSTDSGKYSCFPSNIAGSAEKHFEVLINEPPSISGKNLTDILQEKTVSADIYKRIVLRCPLTGSPEPEISWFKESELINYNDRKFKTSLDKKILVINHVDESTAGIFECSGINDIGAMSFTFKLHIRIPMHWSQWSKWTECNVTCGGGLQSRERECLGGRNEILSEYIHLHNDSCSGPPAETQECNNHICPVDGGWGAWGLWGSCSSSCGRGWRRRTRRCNNPAPAHGGIDCLGETYEDQNCESVPCPIDGNWGEWSDWSDCSATCGPSIKMRTRRCNSPAPDHGGRPCSGNSRDITLCNMKNCPVDLNGWSAWSRWSPCSKTCGVGLQSRFRTCLKETEDGTCEGGKTQRRRCKNAIPCERRRFLRHAELQIHGELNDEVIEETIKAEIFDNNNDTSSISFSKPASENETFSYLPFVVSPVSWLTAEEEERGRNGLSLTNGSFSENSTYRFFTGEEMDVQSDAQSEDSEETLKLKINIKGRVPSVSSAAATVIIDPYSEDIIQTDPNEISSYANVRFDADGQVMPVTVKKTTKFSGSRISRISPIETLTSQGSRSYFNKETHQLEFKANPSVISSKRLRNACPSGFKYNLESGECSDINECRRRGLHTCLPSQICINTMGSYTCECRQGFRVLPFRSGCKDINECEEGLHQCSHRCVNTRGSYQCRCPKHLILAEDMHNCIEDFDDYYVDNPERSDDTDIAGSMEYQLIESPSSIKKAHLSRTGKKLFSEEDFIQDDQSDYIQESPLARIQDFSCRTGFHPGKDGCEDINECAENENSCTREQLCMNTPGSFVCIEAPCPDYFMLSPETRSCMLLCFEEEDQCTDGAVLSESLQILTVPVYKGNYTFYPNTNILEMISYDNNDLPLSGSIYSIAQNEAGLPVNTRTEKRLGVLFATKYFEVTKQERLVLMSSKYDTDGSKLHSTMFVVLIYNTQTDLLN